MNHNFEKWRKEMKDRMFAVLSDHEIPADYRSIFMDRSIEPFSSWKHDEEAHETLSDTARGNWLKAIGKKYPQLNTSNVSDVFLRQGQRIEPEEEFREVVRKFEAMGYSHEKGHFIFRGDKR